MRLCETGRTFKFASFTDVLAFVKFQFIYKPDCTLRGEDDIISMFI